MTFRLCVSLLALLGLVFSAARAQPLEPDPRFTTGVLPNGMGYVVLKHAVPPGQVAVWLQISSGSLNETDRQRGIAHFLEHMAFNGSENFAPGSVVPFFQSLGLTFGLHQNASTGLDLTRYILELKDNTPATLDKALLFFSDVAGRLTLTPTEIEEERGIILEEKRARTSGRQRMQEELLKRLTPGSLVGQRSPIGTEETIQGVQRADFVDYYSRWYTASNMVLMVVGDIEPAVVIEHAAKHFQALPKTPAPLDHPHRLTPTRSPGAIVLSDAELRSADVSLTRIAPPPEPVTTREGFRRELIDDLAVFAFNRRLDTKVARGELALLDAGAGAFNLANAARIITVSGTGKPENAVQMLTQLATELRRALLHGLPEADIVEAGKAIATANERAVDQDDTLPANALLARLSAGLASGDTILSARQRLELVRSFLPSIRPDEVNAAFRTLFDANLIAVAQMPAVDTAQLPTEQALAAVAAEALRSTPPADAPEVLVGRLMEQMPAPGEVVEISEHAPSGVMSAWLGNNVRVHHKYSSYRKNTVLVRIVLAGGELHENDRTRGIARAAAVTFGRPATARLESTQVRDILLKSKAKLVGRAAADALALDIEGPPDDLEVALQLAHLLLTEPRLEATAFNQFRTEQINNLKETELQPLRLMGRALPDILYPQGEVRGRLPTIPHFEALTHEATQAWLDNQIRSAPIEVAVVGDIARERAMELAARFLGSLPARPRISASWGDESRALQRPVGPLATVRSTTVKGDQAVVMSGFYGPDLANVADARRMALAAQVLTTRMFKTLREAEKLVYSIQPQSAPATVFPGFGLFIAVATTDPARTDLLVARIGQLYAEFAANGPSAEEFPVAVNQTIKALEDRMRENSFWAQQLESLEYRGIKLDDLVDAPAAYRAITPDEVRDAFQRYFTPANQMHVVILPGAAPTPAPDAIAPPPAPAPAPAPDTAPKTAKPAGDR